MNSAFPIGGSSKVAPKSVKASEQPKSTIIDQGFENDNLDRSGSIIWVTLSGGQEKVEVPDVSGLRKTQAVKDLIEAGLDIDTPREVKFDQSGEPYLDKNEDYNVVTTTDPPAGTVVDPGKEVEMKTKLEIET